MKIGEKIDNPIKFDEATSLALRGHFSRMCVEIDLEKLSTVTGSTNDTHISSPYRLTSSQCKCQWKLIPSQS